MRPELDKFHQITSDYPVVNPGTGHISLRSEYAESSRDRWHAMPNGYGVHSFLSCSGVLPAATDFIFDNKVYAISISKTKAGSKA